MVPERLREHHAGRAVGNPRGGVPLHGRHDRQGDRLDAPAEGAGTGQAVLHLLRTRSDPRAAPRAEGVGRPVQGSVRRTAGTRSARRRSPARRSSASSRRTAMLTERTRTSRPGRTCPTGSSRCSPVRWRCTPASSRTPTTTSVGCSMPSRSSGVLDDTLVYVIIGDNGASAEGTFNGTTNEGFIMNHFFDLETEEFLIEHMDDLGTPKSYNHYAFGWAHAMDTPYQWTKQIASHWGGTRNGTIVRWPNGISAKGEVRNQFAHCIDVAPTILEAAGHPRAPHRPRRNAADDGGGEPARTASTRRTPPSSTRRSTSRCSPTGPSTTSVGRRCASHKDPVGGAPARAPTTTCGSSTTWRRTGPSPTTSPLPTRRSWPSCSGCS